ncbi:MAG: response regulator [Gemmatimonadales bacterium]|nr:response regulator [Gemmatimonadales bacterium]NIN12851.1 response regulator [Gemmatimonadales bacterium]NIN51029.1 response regulator [Gemmatimonadales bacterium]NIP08493.1 response regulator [Gemmatimonadales bacterium]NIR02533.1 response regulator [Gemmatimonadales bacterium]
MASLEARKVLFIEDEAGLQDAYRRYFGSRYEMAFAGSGEEALLQLDRFEPDVIVLDMRLPDTDGIDVLRQIRSQLADVPVIITTAYSSMEPLMEVLGMGHSGYLLKPYDLNELGARIDAVT